MTKKDTHNDKLTEATRRLLVDPDFLESFRSHPANACRPFGLDRSEIEALKSGDEAELAKLGANVVAVQRSTESPPPLRRTLRLLSRVAPGLAAGALAAGLWAAPASAGERAVPRRVTLRRARRIVPRARRRAARTVRGLPRMSGPTKPMPPFPVG